MPVVVVVFLEGVLCSVSNFCKNVINMPRKLSDPPFEHPSGSHELQPKYGGPDASRPGYIEFLTGAKSPSDEGILPLVPGADPFSCETPDSGWVNSHAFGLAEDGE
jgi:hypothetical protein